MAVATSLVLFACALAGCQSTPSSGPGAVLSEPSQRGPEPLNRRIGHAAAFALDRREASDYHVGPGDILEIDVFDADELDRTVRVRPDGTISLPLLGQLAAAGQTTTSLELMIADRLGAEYLWNPQVSVFVTEFRAHPISVLGEVNEPGVFHLRGPRTLVEILSEAGGLTEQAGTTVHLRRSRSDRATGRVGFDLLAIDLRTHLAGGATGVDLTLRDGDTIFVPEAGVVFVEGAVEKPGMYRIEGGATVLGAITMAGGVAFRASESDVQLIRRSGSEHEIIRLDLAEILRAPETDRSVQDGDVLVVGSSSVKVALDGVWRGLSGLLRVSTGF